jgi:hypothetical protein
MPPLPMSKDPFESIDVADLDRVAGGAARVTARSSGGDSELTAMLTQITSSIKDLASSGNQGMDPMMMMMMMMMMGGGGGGGGGAVAAPAAAPPAINIDTGIMGGGGGGCRRGGKKGW